MCYFTVCILHSSLCSVGDYRRDSAGDIEYIVVYLCNTTVHSRDMMPLPTFREIPECGESYCTISRRHKMNY